MYTIHTTPGFVISSRPSGEAGKMMSIFTRDLGLIRASAQGIRFEKSKLRPFIQDYSFGVFSFVRGKEFWRLTNAQEKEDGVNVLDSRLEVRELVARIALLLGRLLQGEEAHPELFETLDKLFMFLNSVNTDSEVADFSGTNLNEEQFKSLESLIVVRILHRLGYVAVIPDLKFQIESDEITKEILTFIDKKRILINQHINKALRESHL